MNGNNQKTSCFLLGRFNLKRKNLSPGIQSCCQRMIGVSNQLPKRIGPLGSPGVWEALLSSHQPTRWFLEKFSPWQSFFVGFPNPFPWPWACDIPHPAKWRCSWLLLGSNRWCPAHQDESWQHEFFNITHYLEINQLQPGKSNMAMENHEFFS